jgi:GT2 family glycosyltransferase
MELSIIIVNWNSAEYLRRCLSSLYGQAGDVEFEVIVVDNASYDGSANIVKNEFPQTKFVQSNQNLGFSGANNLGCQHSSGQNLLFLNPDTEVLGPAIGTMLSCLKSIPDAGAVGCKHLSPDGSVQVNCIQRFPTIANQVLDTDFLKIRFPNSSLWGVKLLFSESERPSPVEVISGACIMVKRTVFERMGGFSTDYFMYAEDLDLCYRIMKDRFKSYYVGNASIIHYGGVSSDKAQENHFNAVVKRESMRMFLRKHKGKVAAVSYRIITLLVSVARLGIIAFLSLIGFGRLFGGPSLKGAFGRWRKVLRWSLGLERWSILR